MDALTPEQDKLYEKICAHLTTLCTQTSFLARLAKENQWSTQFAQKVVEEYAKFLFIAKVTERPVSPPAMIDKAWHLHLVNTEDYWQKLCPKVLQMEFHHAPEIGDGSDSAKLAAWTQDTLNSYRRYFGAPPAIWTRPERTKLRTVLISISFIFFGISLGALLSLLFNLHAWQVALPLAGAFLTPAIILFLAANLSVSKTMCGGASCSGSGCSGAGGGHSCGGGH